MQNKTQKVLTFSVPVKALDGSAGWRAAANESSTGGTKFTAGLSGVNFQVGRGGYMTIQDVPCAFTGYYLQDAYAVTVNFAVSGNTASTFYFYNGATVQCQANDVFASPVSIGNALSVNHNGIIKLNGYSQTTITSFSTAKRDGGDSALYFPRIQSSSKAQIVLQGDQQVDGGVLRFLLQDYAGFCWNPSDGKTVILSTEAQTTKGDLGVLNGTMKLVDGATFTQMDTLTVGATGILDIEEGSGAGFCAKKLVLQEGASLVLGKDVALTVDAATLGMTPLTAGKSYCGSDGPAGMTRLDNITGAGYVTVRIPLEPTSTALWDAGAGSDTSIGTAANWQGDVVPDLTSGGTLAQFAEGSAVLVNRDVWLNGLDVTMNSGDFAINGNGGCGMALYGHGIDIVAGTSARAVTVSVPLDIGQSQTWKVSGTGDKLCFTGGLTGLPSAVATLSGYGAVGLEGSATYAGEVRVSQSGSVGASRFVLANADLAGSLTIQTASTTFSDFYSNGDRSAAASRSSIVRGKTMLNAGGLYLRFQGLMTFAGGLSLAGPVYLCENGRYVITNAPISATQAVTWFSDSATTTELWAEDNWINLILYNGARVFCNTPGALNGHGGLILGTNAFDMDRRGSLWMTGDQSVASFTTYVARHGSRGEEITGEGLATLTTADATDRDHYAIFKGGASYRQTGTGHARFFKSSTSTGTVEVVAGTLTFENATNGLYRCVVGQKDYEIASEGGSWSNAVSIAVGGGDAPATVRVLHNGTFGRSAKISIGTNGTLHLAAGVVEKVGSLIVNGVDVGAGLYGSPTSSAMNKLDCITGDGILRVGRVGLVMMFW